MRKKPIFISLFALVCLLALTSCTTSTQKNDESPWNKLDSLLSRITPPVFPHKDFLVTDYGAVGDNKTDCSTAFRKAVEACSQGGGGRVVVPEGRYKTGAIHLKSNVNLHLSEGATIAFSTNPKDYLPLVVTRWEGVDLMNYSPLVYAFGEKNIAITGSGTLDGCADNTNWWPWKGRDIYGWKEGMEEQNADGRRPALFDMGEKGVPVEERIFGEGFYLRPQFIQPYKCENILIEGITILNSPMWIIHPVLSNNITIRNVHVNSDGPNSDGCDPESCKDVLIKDCYFNTGDDCIAIKSGRNADGRRIGIPCENIIIQNCTMENGHGGVVIGSEISGGARYVFAENSKMSSPLLDRALRIKTSSMRGGTIEDIYMRNVEVGQVKQEAIYITMFYEDKGDHMPIIKNIGVENLRVKQGGKVGIRIEGYKASPVTDIYLKDIDIETSERAYQLENVENLCLENVKVNDKELNTGDVQIGNAERTPTW
ncbi:glycoside hydrolase family 28 protein [Bacteroides sp. 51]|uniref:glycoside hydrolase family 28 protein n=1 Tax=Bacteroides sp. 51 TaxID=2302938 RepID=UPI0013D60B3A|nr:glycoside hydrolase family 28 protein [Bacteroides sp. 51]NDV83249.1 glycoside hydrolase family 28 protein [Bacteroides sp. 51]